MEMDRGIVTPSPSAQGPTTMDTANPDPQDDDHAETAGAAAAGVTVTVVVVLLIAGIAYWYYRKKYPVRMIVGRDFAKFSNPAYSRNSTGPTHTLVREDADTFFQQTQPTGPVPMGIPGAGADDEEARVCYINTGFQYDSEDVDEEEVERRFRQQKAYLFKKDEDEEEDKGTGGEGGNSAKDESQTDGTAKAGKSKAKVNGRAGRDRGHDNAAFAGDSDDEGEDRAATDATGEGSTKKKKKEKKEEKADNGSVSSDVSGSTSSKKAGKEDDSENESPQEIPAEALSAVGIQGRLPNMTVRDFLMLAAREKRALSDASRARAGSDASRTFEFDIMKSARRRAQSAGDIWATAAQALPSPTREELLMNRPDASGDNKGSQQPNDSKTAHASYENWTVPESVKDSDDGNEKAQSVLDGNGVTQPTTHDGRGSDTQSVDENYENLASASKPSPDDKGDTAQSDELDETSQQVTVIEVQLEEDQEEGGVKNSHFVDEGSPASDGDEPPSQNIEDETDAERNRADSSNTSDSSYDKVLSSEVGDLQSAVHNADRSSVQSQEEEGRESPHGGEMELSASVVAEIVMEGPEDEESDYVNVDRTFQTSVLPAASGASSGVGHLSELSGDGRSQLPDPRAETTSGVTLLVGDEPAADDMVDGSALLSTSVTGSVGSGMDKSDTLSFDTVEEFSSDKHPPGNGPSDDVPDGSMSSSLVIVDKRDLEDQHAKDNDSGDGSFQPGTSSYGGDKLSVEDEDFDMGSHDLYDRPTKPDFEHGGAALSFGSSGTEHKPSVQVLPTLSYSDNSSVSSAEEVEPPKKKDQSSDASRWHEPQQEPVPRSHKKQQHAASEDEGKSTPSQLLVTAGSGVTAAPGQASPDRRDNELERTGAVLESVSSPPQSSPVRGLAALRTHPGVVRPSESESEGGMELSVEDIQQALEGSDVSSSEEDLGPPPPPPQSSPPRTRPIKIAPTEKFVFSEDPDDDDDIDV